MMTMMLPAHPFHRPARYNGRRVIFDHDDSRYPSTLSVFSQPHLFSGSFFNGEMDDYFFKPAHDLERQAQCLAKQFSCFENKKRQFFDFSFDVESIINADGNMEIMARLPGMKKEDITLEINNGALVISINKTEEKQIEVPIAKIEALATPTAIESAKPEKSTNAGQIPPKDVAKEAGSMLDQLHKSASNQMSIFEEEPVKEAQKTTESTSLTTSVQDVSATTAKASEEASSQSPAYQKSSFYAHRRVQLPKNFIEANIIANLEDDLLKILVPIRQSEPTARRLIYIQ